VSFAGVSVTVIVLAAIFVALIALGFTGYRRGLLAAIVAFYPATLIYQNFPWYVPQTPGAAIGLWVGCFLVCFWALRNRIDSASWPKLGNFGAAVCLALAATAEVIALYVTVLPLENFFALPSQLIVAASVSLILPIVFMLVWFF
jgi:hypothetical protein